MAIEIHNVLAQLLSTFQKNWNMGFPGGTVVKNLPANGEDKGSIPGLEQSYMPRGS